MSSPTPNIFSTIEQFSDILGLSILIETRIENDENGNPIYVGYSPIPNASTSEPVWVILKISYTGTSITRKQLPDGNIKFTYVWDDRTLYFS